MTSWLARRFPRFAAVRPHELRRALLLALDLFVLMLAYYLLKTAREVLILVAPGARAELKTYAAGLEGLLLVGLSLLFGALAAHVRRRSLLLAVITFFAVQLVGFDVVLQAMHGHRLVIGVVFFVWLGCFNVLIVALFWAFTNDLYTREDGERLFPLIAFGGSLGAVGGAWLARPLFHAIGTERSLLVAAGLLLVALLLAIVVDVRATGAVSAEPVGGPSGPTLLRDDRYLRWIALLALSKNCINALGEYLLDWRLLDHANHLNGNGAARDYIVAFKSNYLTLTNVLALVLQAALVPWLMRRFGAGLTLLVLPLFLLSGYAAAMVVPALTVVLAVKIAENGADYSVQKTAEQALYLVTPRAAKYKAKAIIDTVVVRVGDVLAALVVAGAVALALPLRGAVAVLLVLVVVTLAISIALALDYRRRDGAVGLNPQAEARAGGGRWRRRWRWRAPARSR